MNDLAVLLSISGKYEESESLLVKKLVLQEWQAAIAVYERTLGKEHGKTLRLRNAYKTAISERASPH